MSSCRSLGRPCRLRNQKWVRSENEREREQQNNVKGFISKRTRYAATIIIIADICWGTAIEIEIQDYNSNDYIVDFIPMMTRFPIDCLRRTATWIQHLPEKSKIRLVFCLEIFIRFFFVSFSYRFSLPGKKQTVEINTVGVKAFLSTEWQLCVDVVRTPRVIGSLLLGYSHITIIDEIEPKTWLSCILSSLATLLL